MQTLIHRSFVLVLATMLMCIGVSHTVHAQERSVRIIARRTAEGVILRWAPTNPTSFADGRRYGYRVERATVASDGTIGAFGPVLEGQPFQPFDREAFDGIAYQFRGSDSTRMVYRQFAYSVLFEPMDASLSAAEAEESLRLQLGFALLSADRDTIAAIALGLAFYDEELTDGQRYAYRVALEARRSDPLAADTIIVDAQVYAPTPKQDRVVVEPGDGEVTMKWPAGLGYGAYVIERSDNNGIDWAPLTSAPMITLITGDTVPGDEFHRDTNLLNNKPYRYRLYGLTSFADEELIADVVATPRDLTPPAAPTGVSVEELQPGIVRVTWEMAEPTDSDLADFFVSRGTEDQGPFNRISSALPPNTRQFTDSSGRFASTNYYIVEVRDTAGNIAPSFSAYLVLADSTPPQPPTLLEGVIDTNGVVTLRFERPTDADYMGYRLLRANDSTHEFSVIAERFTNDTLDVLNEQEYRDTIELRTLTRDIFYRMYALDFHHNESAPSLMLRVVRPDVVPPVAPVITGYVVTDSSMIIDFAPSSSEDVARHMLLRRPASATSWDTAKALPAPWGRAVDDAEITSQLYDYAIVAFDEAGLPSDVSNVVSGKRYDTGVRPTVGALQARYDSVARVVTLSWEYRDLPEDHSFVVYRSDGSTMRSHAVIERRQGLNFVEQVNVPTAEIRYAIKVVTESGAESVLSASVTVNLR